MVQRRQFLKHLGTGAIGSSVLSSLLEVRAAAAQQIISLDLEKHTASTFQQLKTEYLLNDDVVYLNHASIGTIPRVVHDAREQYLRLCETNPWLYMWGGAWEEPREQVRAACARVLGCSADEVTITHNTTEAFNILANGLPLGAGDEVLFSSLNHTGASEAFFHTARSRGFEVKRFQFPLVDASSMTKDEVVAHHVSQITSRTKLLVFPHIDNIVGIRHPVREIAAAARARGVQFIAVDAAQTVGMIPVDVSQMGVDVYATSPHKWLQAPKGLGLSYMSPALIEHMSPMWVTWGQNRWKGNARVFEDYGTRNLAEVLAMGDAIEFQNTLSASERETRLKQLRSHAFTRAEQHPRAGRASPAEWELNGALFAISIRGRDVTEMSRTMYEDHGLVFRPFNTQGINAVRLSPNVFNTESEIDRFFELL